MAVLLWKLGLASIGKTNYDGETSLLTHALMLSNVLGPQNAINVIWTLSYEMAFYPAGRYGNAAGSRIGHP